MIAAEAIKIELHGATNHSTKGKLHLADLHSLLYRAAAVLVSSDIVSSLQVYWTYLCLEALTDPTSPSRLTASFLSDWLGFRSTFLLSLRSYLARKCGRGLSTHDLTWRTN